MDPPPRNYTIAGDGGTIGTATTAATTAFLRPSQTPTSNASSACANPPDDQNQNLKQIISSIKKTLGLLHLLYLTVSSFNLASQQLPLLRRLNAVVTELATMKRLAEGCNFQVPMEVINLIDDGKSPDTFTRDLLNTCIAKNQSIKGKTDAFKCLRRHLLEELEQAFPDEVEAYREIRTTPD